MFRIQEIWEYNYKENSELKYQLVLKSQKKEKASMKDASVQAKMKVGAITKSGALDTSIQNLYVNRLKAKLRHYMKIIDKYRGFLDEIRNDYEMPSELIGNIENMQVNDSIQLMSSFWASNLEVDSGLYDNTFDDGKTENTFDLLEYDFSKELKSLKPDVSGNTTNKPSHRPSHKTKHRQIDTSTHKTNSYFNYIKQMNNSRANVQSIDSSEDSYRKSINNSESFHYRPQKKKERPPQWKKALKERVDELQEKEGIDRSLSLPKFDTFNALPHIKQTAKFSNEVEENLPENQVLETPRNMVQESIRWEEENIDMKKEDSKEQKDDSIMDSFLLELTAKKPQSKSTEIGTKNLKKKKSRNKHMKFIKQSDLRFSKQT